MTKERAITFSGEDVRAILEGRMASFRRPIFRDGQPESHMVWLASGKHWQDGDDRLLSSWKVGDRLWVREGWISGYHDDDYGDLITTDASAAELGQTVWYKATDGELWWWQDGESRGRAQWKSSSTMPRWASRITLEIVSVHAERSVNDWEWVVTFMVVDGHYRR